MSTLKPFLLVGLLILSSPLRAEPVGTSFTYQGELQQSGVPANGKFDFQFNLYDIEAEGIALISPIQLEDVSVQGGVFTVDLDFGQSPYTDQKLWLGIGVREGSSEGIYTLLSPRQALNSTPFALFALSGNEGPEVGPQTPAIRHNRSRGGGISRIAVIHQVSFSTM